MDTRELPFELPPDDSFYFAWLDSHPNGFVLNSNRSLSPRLTFIHDAWCGALRRSRYLDDPGGFTARDYLKVYAEDIASLERWLVARRPNGSARRHECKPMKEGGGRTSFTDRFAIGHTYTKHDIYERCAVPQARRRGAWDTGYVLYEGAYFVFCNIGDVARTGHDYDNRIEGNLLVWYGKTGSRPDHPSIGAMLDPATPVLVFSRANNRDPFTYRGRARAVTHDGSDPVRIVWSFEDRTVPPLETLAQEVVDDTTSYREGAVKQITVNAYERDQRARRACIAKHGAVCAVCRFRFDAYYGAIGVGFIEVHHLKPLSQAGGERVPDPTEDLRPVCSNCHSMLHRRNPPYAIDELVELIRAAKKK